MEAACPALFHWIFEIGATFVYFHSSCRGVGQPSCSNRCAACSRIVKGKSAEVIARQPPPARSTRNPSVRARGRAPCLVTARCGRRLARGQGQERDSLRGGDNG